MALLPLVPVSDFSPALADAVAHGVQTRMLSSTVPMQVWAHRPLLAQAWLATLDQLHNHSVIEPRVRELVRLRIAAFTTCHACQVARKTGDISEIDVACLSSDDERFSLSERSALRYAELFASDPQSIDEFVFADLSNYFSVPQVVELNMFCALMFAGGRMTQAQQAYEA